MLDIMELRDLFAQHFFRLRAMQFPVESSGDTFTYPQIVLCAEANLIHTLFDNAWSFLSGPNVQDSIEWVELFMDNLGGLIRAHWDDSKGSALHPLVSENYLLLDFLIDLYRLFYRESPAADPEAEAIYFLLHRGGEVSHMVSFQETSASSIGKFREVIYDIQPVIQPFEFLPNRAILTKNFMHGIIVEHQNLFSPATLFADIELERLGKNKKYAQAMMSKLKATLLRMQETHSAIYHALEKHNDFYKKLISHVNGSLRVYELLQNLKLNLSAGGKFVTGNAQEASQVAYLATAEFFQSIDKIDVAQRSAINTLSTGHSPVKTIIDVIDMLKRGDCVEVIATQLQYILDNPANKVSLLQRLTYNADCRALNADLADLGLMDVDRDRRTKAGLAIGALPAEIMLNAWSQGGAGLEAEAIIKLIHCLVNQPAINQIIVFLMKNPALLDQLFVGPHTVQFSLSPALAFMARLFIEVDASLFNKLVHAIDYLGDQNLYPFRTGYDLFAFQKILTKEQFELLVSAGVRHIKKIRTWRIDEFYSVFESLREEGARQDFHREMAQPDVINIMKHMMIISSLENQSSSKDYPRKLSLFIRLFWVSLVEYKALLLQVTPAMFDNAYEFSQWIRGFQGFFNGYNHMREAFLVYVNLSSFLFEFLCPKSIAQFYSDEEFQSCFTPVWRFYLQIVGNVSSWVNDQAQINYIESNFQPKLIDTQDHVYGLLGVLLPKAKEAFLKRLNIKDFCGVDNDNQISGSEIIERFFQLVSASPTGFGDFLLSNHLKILGAALSRALTPVQFL